MLLYLLLLFWDEHDAKESITLRESTDDMSFSACRVFDPGYLSQPEEIPY